MSILGEVMRSCERVEELKKGGQRTAYKAVHPEHGLVVIKHTQYQSPKTLERVSREAELLRSLDCPCIPTLYEFMVDPSRREALTIEEYIPGDELQARKADYKSERQIIGLLRALANCMQVPWAKRVVHRDLKPSNILITSDGRPHVIDFGIARFLDKESLTNTVAMMGPGTAMYAAPEQLENRKTEVDARTDFFALGIIALELHLGRHPFSPEAVGGDSIPANIVSGRYLGPETKEGTTQTFVTLIRRLLQVEPYLRFRTPAALSAYLQTHWGCDL